MDSDAVCSKSDKRATNTKQVTSAKKTIKRSLGEQFQEEAIADSGMKLKPRKRPDVRLMQNGKEGLPSSPSLDRGSSAAVDPQSDNELSSHNDDHESDNGLLSSPKSDEEMDTEDSSDEELSCPACIKYLFENLKEGVDELKRTNSRYKESTYDQRIGRLEQTLKKERNHERKSQLKNQIQEQIFFRQGIDSEATRQFLLWADANTVHSLRHLTVTHVTNDENNTEEEDVWDAEVWISEHLLEEVLLDEKYVKQLLTPFAFQKSCFSSNKFVPLKKYDRQQTVNETHFDRIKYVGPNSYTLVDGLGCEVVGVTDHWVRSNISPGTRKKAERAVLLGIRYSIRIPVGSSLQVGLPKVMYQNEGSQCLLKSLASALHYLQHTAMALHISQGYDRGCKGHEFNESMAFIKGTMKQHGKIPLRKRMYQPEELLNRTHNPIVSSLKAVSMVEGVVRPVQINHCVCFVGDFIFDSNRETALPNNPISLDLICNDIVPGATYGGIFWSRELLLVRDKNK